jgi:hypothetical protein
VKTQKKPQRWSKWDSFRDGRQEIDSPKEMAKLRREIDAGWRYFLAKKMKREALES